MLCHDYIAVITKASQYNFIILTTDVDMIQMSIHLLSHVEQTADTDQILEILCVNNRVLAHVSNRYCFGCSVYASDGWIFLKLDD